jgi:hypothetical protein
MKELPFSVMLDGSNDSGILKMFPVTVRIFDVNFSRVMTKFVDMNLLEGPNASTAESMFNSDDELFNEHSISWDTVTAIGVDNTNANNGAHNSIKSRVLGRNPNVFVSGCPCHILHNAAGKGGSAFAEVTDFDVEDHLVDLFYWFDKSSKRKSSLKEYYEFCDSEYEEVIKYVSTRWLAL